jgi:hypothetical protein
VKKTLTAAALSLLITSLLSAATPSSPQGAKPAAASSAKSVDLPAGGRLAGDLYTNSEYKLELRIPNGFAVTHSTPEDDKRGAELMAGGSEQRKRDLEAATDRTATLLEVTLQKPGIYRTATLMTEDISSAPLIESGKDYINNVMAQLLASKMKFKAGDTSEENLDGRSFSTKVVEMQVNNTVIYQAYSATIIGRRALAFVLTSESSVGLRQLMTDFKPHFLGPLPPAQNADSRLGQSQDSYVKNGVYSNPSFKMNFRVPPGWTMREGAREAVEQSVAGNKGDARTERSEKAKIGLNVLFVATPPESTNSVMMMSIPLNGSRITPAAALESVIVAAQSRGFQPVSKSDEKKISGQRFNQSVLKGFADGLDVYQAYNTTVLNDHILCFVVTAHDPEQLDNLIAISTKSLDFD